MELTYHYIDAQLYIQLLLMNPYIYKFRAHQLVFY